MKIKQTRQYHEQIFLCVVLVSVFWGINPVVWPAFNSVTGASACIACPPGSYYNSTGALFNLWPQSITPIAGCVAAKIISLGQDVDNPFVTGVSACRLCSAGYYYESTGTSYDNHSNSGMGAHRQSMSLHSACCANGGQEEMAGRHRECEERWANS